MSLRPFRPWTRYYAGDVTDEEAGKKKIILEEKVKKKNVKGQGEMAEWNNGGGGGGRQKLNTEIKERRD
jgi:hypothetical protein